MAEINYKHLHYFWVVAKAGGIARASEQLHLTPQTISSQIQLLEEQLRTPLLRKQGRRLELTEAGRRALRYADEIFALGSELKQAMREHPKGAARIEFRVGITDAVPKSIAYSLLEPALVLLGLRGRRARAEQGDRARRWIAATAAVVRASSGPNWWPAVSTVSKYSVRKRGRSPAGRRSQSTTASTRCASRSAMSSTGTGSEVLSQRSRWSVATVQRKRCSISCRIAVTSSVPKCRPMHLCTPPPNGLHAMRWTLSSARSLLKRSGSKVHGSFQYSGSRWLIMLGTVTMVPLGR